MKFQSLYVFKTQRYNSGTNEWEGYYDTTITMESKEKHEIELNLSDEQAVQILKVVSPMLEQAFVNISKEVKEQLTADETEYGKHPLFNL